MTKVTREQAEKMVESARWETSDGLHITTIGGYDAEVEKVDGQCEWSVLHNGTTERGDFAASIKSAKQAALDYIFCRIALPH